MKALILNGAIKTDSSMSSIKDITKEVITNQGYNVESIMLHEKDIGPCLGCFCCWVQTPGECIIDDYGRELIDRMINSDLVVYMTPVVYGGYSSELKKAMDRIIPLILPFFKKINGEIHHKERYKVYPKVIVLGIMPNEDNEMEEIFNGLIKRNALNWYNSFIGGTIRNDSDKDIRTQLEEVLKALEVQT